MMSGKRRIKLDTAVKVIIVLVVVAIALVLALVWYATMVGAINAWILGGAFWDGWHAVWAQPLKSFGVMLLFSIAAGGLRFAR